MPTRTPHSDAALRHRECGKASEDFTTPAHAGDHDQLSPGDIDIDPLEIMLPRALESESRR